MKKLFGAAAAAAVLTVAVGCTSTTEPDGPSAPTSAAIDAGATSGSTGPTPVQTAGNVGINEDVLLLPIEMPAWDQAGYWNQLDEDDQVVLQACPMPGAAELGALAALTRGYEYVVELGEGDVADPDAEPMVGVNHVGFFADNASAQQAADTWTQALQDCGAQQLGSQDSGSTWTVSAAGGSDAGRWFDFTGVAVEGQYATLAGFSVFGQDADTTQDPLAATMRSAVERLP